MMGKRLLSCIQGTLLQIPLALHIETHTTTTYG